MTVITGALIQSEFNSEVEVEDIEVIIDSAIDTVNSDAGVSIGYMTGVSPNKTVTVTGAQAAALKPLIAMKLASHITSGSSSVSSSLGPASYSVSSSSSSGDVNAGLYRQAIIRLIGKRFERV